MFRNDINAVLGDFNQDDYTVKLCQAIYSSLPFAPEFVFYNDLNGAFQRLAPGASPELRVSASTIAASEDIGKAVWLTDAIDTADKGLGIATGIFNVLSFFDNSSQKKRTFEADPQQAVDAALKATGLAYMIYKLFPGEVKDKINAFKELPAGQELAIYFALAEITLPFTDNLAEAGGNIISRLLGSNQSKVTSRFASFAGKEAYSQAAKVLGALGTPLGDYIEKSKSFSGVIMGKITDLLPTAMNIGDSATGAAATGVDVMPVWRFLGSRLIAEACVWRAKNGV